MAIKIEAAYRLKADSALIDRGSVFVESLGFKVLDKNSDRRLTRDNDLPYEVEAQDIEETVAHVTAKLNVEPKRTVAVTGNTWSWYVTPEKYVTLLTYVARAGHPVWVVHVVDREYGIPFRPSSHIPKGPSRIGYRK